MGFLVIKIRLAEMEKAYKIALAKRWAWKSSAQNMCKNAQNHAKMDKSAKHKKKKSKTLLKPLEETKNYYSCEKLAQAARLQRPPFSISEDKSW